MTFLPRETLVDMLNFSGTRKISFIEVVYADGLQYTDYEMPSSESAVCKESDPIGGFVEIIWYRILLNFPLLPNLPILDLSP